MESIVSHISEQAIQDLLKQDNHCLYLWDQHGRILAASPTALKFFGVPSKEDIYNKHFTFMPEYQPDGNNSLTAMAYLTDHALQFGNTSVNWLYKMSNGRHVDCRLQLHSGEYTGKKVVCAFVSQLFQEENNTNRQVQQRLQDILDSSPLICLIFDINANLLDCNERALTFSGIADKHQFVENFFEIAPEKQPGGEPSRDRAQQVLRIADEKGYCEADWMHTIHGQEYPCEVHIKKYNLEDDNKVFVVHALDMREHYKDKDTERIAQQRLQAMLDSSPLLCAVYDKNGKCLEVSQGAEPLFGIVDKQWFIDDVLAFFPRTQPDGQLSQDKFANKFKQAFEKGSLTLEWMYQTMDAEPIPCEEYLERVILNDRECVICYVRDLREHKRILAKAEEAFRREHLANQSKTRFLARMSHEIRTPMNAVIGITEIELQKDNNPPDIEEALLNIYSSSSLLLTIINDILDLAKIEAGKMEVVPDKYETVSLISDTLQLNLMHLRSNKLMFKLNIDDRLPSHMTGDVLRIKQILNNMLSNAFKYTQEGEVVLSFRLEGTLPEATLVVVVEDTGQGMTKEQTDSLFGGEFTRFNPQYNHSIEGTGLGMFITHQLVSMMGGRIDVASQMGKGSTFTVRIPQESDSEEPIDPEMAAQLKKLEVKNLRKINRRSRMPMPYGKVLVVDDVESNLYVAKGFLAQYQLQIDTADSGFDAIDKVRKGEVYDIIFMDHMMPGMDGIEATKALHEMGYDRPIVALTANNLKGHEELFLNNGFCGFIPKPINTNLLNSYLMRFVGRKQATGQIQSQAVDTALRVVTQPAKDLSEKLTEAFLRDAIKAVALLERILSSEKLDEDTLKTYTTCVHGMKSALGNIGEEVLSQTASSLEQAGRSAAAIHVITPRFLENLKTVMKARTGEDNEDTSDEDPQSLQNLFTSICGFCQDYNKRGAQRKLNELKNMKCSKQTREAAAQLVALLLHSEFEEAAELAKTQARRY